LKVAVIGSSGGMGRFFAGYFLSHGSKVTGHDVRRPKKQLTGLKLARSNAEAVKNADVVLIATPVDKTVEALEDIVEKLPAGVVVIEITSLKGKVLREMKSIAKGRGLRLLSIHPLFGPSLGSYGEMKICVVETDDGSESLAQEIFPEAAILKMKWKEHDRTMGIILSLTHLTNLAYAGTVSRYLQPDEFRKVQTPTSAVQLTLAEGILSQDPSLYSYIQLENGSSAEFARALIDELGLLLRFIEKKDRRGFEKRFGELSKRYHGDSKAALDLVYQAFEKSTC
jgi:prephenate dehydrogenase